MAKSTIVLEDDGEGGFDISVVFNPALKTDEKPTPAQMLAMAFVEEVKAQGGEEVH